MNIKTKFMPKQTKNDGGLWSGFAIDGTRVKVGPKNSWKKKIYLWLKESKALDYGHKSVSAWQSY